MRFQFSPRSALHGRTVRQPIARYVMAEDNGVTEHILCYVEHIPDPSEEPELRRDAEVRADGDAVILSYSGIPTEQVWLMTVANDDVYREEHPEIVSHHEILRVDDD